MHKYTLHGFSLATTDQGSGLPVVLVHGFPLDHAMWDAQITALSARQRVLAPDLRGFGESGVTEGTVTMEQFADDLADLLDAAGIREPAVLCGLSMGGYVAFEFWRKYAARLRGLVLCDTRANADTPEAAANRRQTAQRVLAEGPAFLAETMIPKLLAPGTLQTRPDIVNTLRQMILSCNAGGVAAASRGMAERMDFTPHLAEIRCPTLVLVGSKDAISTAEEMRAMAGKIPGAKFVAIEGAGHMSPMERPAEVSAAIGAFLAELKESGTATGS